jgi:membrane dipeptidase
MPIPIFDGHNDTLTRLHKFGEDGPLAFLEGYGGGHLDLPRARAGGLAGGIFAIYTPAPPDSPEADMFYGATFTPEGYQFHYPSPLDPDYAHDYTHAVMHFLYELEAQSEGAISIVRAYEDLERNLHDGTLSVVLHLEGADAIREDLADLKTYYTAGVRSLGPVWSRPNPFGSGVPFRFPSSPDTGPGLTDAGRNLVRECNRLGILIDLAHITERGFWEVAALSNSHAGVHALCPSSRNLTDPQIDAIGQSNGLFAIIFEPGNLRRDGKPGTDIPITEIVRHITYVVERIGIDHVAFGSDFDGADIPDDLRDAAGLPKLLDALSQSGFSDDAIAQIAYRNWFRLLRQTWKE